MWDAEHDSIWNSLDVAFLDAEACVKRLTEVAGSETVGQEWSSQVTRCQTQISDALKKCKGMLFELDVMVEEEDRCDCRDVYMLKVKRHSLPWAACCSPVLQHVSRSCPPGSLGSERCVRIAARRSSCP
jgi:hypothetical protein